MNVPLAGVPPVSPLTMMESPTVNPWLVTLIVTVKALELALSICLPLGNHSNACEPSRNRNTRSNACIISVSCPTVCPVGYLTSLVVYPLRLTRIALESNASTTLSALLELGSLNMQDARTLTFAASLIGVVDSVPVWSLILVSVGTEYDNVSTPVTVRVTSPFISTSPTRPATLANAVPVNPCPVMVIVTTPAATLAAVMLFAESIKKNGNCNGLPPLVNELVLATTPLRGFQYPSILPFSDSLTSPTSSWFNCNRWLTLRNPPSPSEDCPSSIALPLCAY